MRAVALSYRGNGACYGFVPVPSAGAAGQEVVVQGNAGGLYRPGYSIVTK